MESLCPSPVDFDFTNWNFDGFVGDVIPNDDSWLLLDSGLITDGAVLAGIDPVLAPAATSMPEICFDGDMPPVPQFLTVCTMAAVQENSGIDSFALNPGEQVQAHPQPLMTATNAPPTNHTDIPLVEHRRVSIPTLTHFAAPAAPARRRSRAGSIATLNRQAQCVVRSAQPKSPHDLTFGRRASITLGQSRKRKHSVCDVPLRRPAAPRAELPRRPRPQVAHHAPCHPPPPPVVPTHNLAFPRLSLSCDLLGLNLPPPEPHFELPAVVRTLPEGFEDLPVGIQKAMIDKARTPPFVTCGWAGCKKQVPPDRPSLRDHLNKFHGGRPTPDLNEGEDPNDIRVQCQWGVCSQWVGWGGMSRHLLSHVCPGSGHCMLCGGSLGRSDMVGRHIKGCWKRTGKEMVRTRLKEFGILEMVLSAPVEAGAGKNPRPRKRAKKA